MLPGALVSNPMTQIHAMFTGSLPLLTTLPPLCRHQRAGQRPRDLLCCGGQPDLQPKLDPSAVDQFHCVPLQCCGRPDPHACCLQHTRR